jgi:UTP:GlnB (protein PII) uridylyltransferase
LDIELWEPEQQKSKKLLMKLCDIHCNTSHYFKRFFLRVVSQYPAYIQYLQDTPQLAQVSKGILSYIDSLDTFDAKKKRLGDYHDLEFLRVGLEALHGLSIEKIDADFTEFSDSHLQMLFDICKQAVNEKIGGYKPTRDLIAIYTAGGYAREQAFDDDYDLIIFLNEKDEDIRKYCSQIITMMNTEIVKRGIMPHYRFADHFGDYITLVDDLDDFFSQDNEDAFIDKSQVLGARMIVGSTKFQKEFEERIIRPHIFDKYDQYKDQMMREMNSRHKDKKVAKNKNLNVKEGVGGLRDIEILLLIYKARYQLKEPVNRKLMKTICEINASYHDDLCSLNEHFNFLKQLRDLYRLTVFAGNELQPEYLESAAKIMGYFDDQSGTATEKLVQDYFKRTKETHQVVEKLAAELSVERGV